MKVVAKEAIKFLFMERESCDYDIYLWVKRYVRTRRQTPFISKKLNELPPKLKHPSVVVKKVRDRLEYHIK